METNASYSSQDDARSARDALEAAARSEAVARHPRLPGWYFPVMALVVAAVMAAQMLPSSRRVALLGAAIVVILMVNRYVQTSAGLVWDSTRLRGQVPFLVAVLGVVVATAVTVTISEDDRVWAVGAAVTAAVVLVAGAIYARQSPADV
jgi:tellurite resistance protein TehA-like permease